MREANRAVKREHYPMPNIDAAIASIHKVSKLSKIDLESAYYHFELDPESRKITTFTSRSGVYRFRRLMFGIKSAPELFQRAMENLFRGIDGLVVFMDDFLVHGETDEKHDKTLEEVLKRLKELNFRINEKKSLLGVTEVTFLGHIISTKGIKPTEDKIQAILDLRSPKNVTELKSLMGMINFVGKFIPNLATLTSNMRQLLIKGVPFNWNQPHNQELGKIKSILGRVESLGFYDPKDETLLVTDASPVGVGSILIQVKDGISRAVYCASKSLAVHERKYCQTEKECYAIVWAMEKFYMYLYGKRFTLITDCKPLQYLFNRVRSKPSARIERWILRLQAFDFDVQYEPGDKNLADSFSRLSIDDSGVVGEADVVSWLAKEMMPMAITVAEVEQESLQDEDLSKVREALSSGVWDDVPIQYRARTIKDDLIGYGGLILRGDRVVIPRSLQEKIVQLGHLGHQGSTGIKAHIRTKVWFPEMDKMVEKVVNNCKPCKMTSLPDKPNPIIRRIPTKPWQDLAMDFKEGLPSGKSLFVVVCYTSRFIQIEPMKPATSQRVISALLRMFASFGIPRSITADNGPQFRSTEMKQFCKSYGIHLNLSTPYWPEQNRAVERQMRNLGKRVKISVIQDTDWEADLLDYLLMYHSTPQETTGVSPGQMMFGRELRNAVPSLEKKDALDWEGARDHDMILKEKCKNRCDERRAAKPHSLKQGDLVIMRNLKPGALEPRFSAEEYEVVDINGGEVKIRSKDNGKIYVRNSSHLKKLEHDQEVKGSEVRGEVIEEEGNLEEEEQVRVSKRRVQPPKRFDDFVL